MSDFSNFRRLFGAMMQESEEDCTWAARLPHYTYLECANYTNYWRTRPSPKKKRTTTVNFSKRRATAARFSDLDSRLTFWHKFNADLARTCGSFFEPLLVACRLKWKLSNFSSLKQSRHRVHCSCFDFIVPPLGTGTLGVSWAGSSAISRSFG